MHIIHFIQFVGRAVGLLLFSIFCPVDLMRGIFVWNGPRQKRQNKPSVIVYSARGPVKIKRSSNSPGGRERNDSPKRTLHHRPSKTMCTTPSADLLVIFYTPPQKPSEGKSDSINCANRTLCGK